MIYQYLTTPRDNSAVNAYASEYIDIRDVADAIVAAMKTEEAGGERFILDAGEREDNLYREEHLSLILHSFRIFHFPKSL